MKLITKIYLSIGFILFLFIVVTVTYLLQSQEVREDLEEALQSAEVLRLSEALQKNVVDTETGIRGYVISRNSEFLEPYFEGKEEYRERLESIRLLLKHERQHRDLDHIDSLYQDWQQNFAEPTLLYLGEALKSPAAQPQFDAFHENYIVKGAGRKRLEKVRIAFEKFDQEEISLKNERLQKLNASLDFTEYLSVALTLLTILIGVITAILLGRTILKRLNEMVGLAQRVAQGNFDVTIQDQQHDEISTLSDSLNTMAQKLKNSFNTLDKRNQELDQFAYVVSHDLKAPLRGINSLAEWIQEDLPHVEPDVQRNLELLRNRVLRLENLINGILEYSRVGKKNLPKERVNTEELVHEVIEHLTPERRFSFTVQQPLPVVHTERILLQQVFSNLISNAIKYHDKPRGHIMVSSRDCGSYHEFTVADDGPGIPKEFHERIFRIFQTMESRDTRESTGIGLAIVKKIIEEKNGRIRIESEAGKGAAFIFTWPKD